MGGAEMKLDSGGMLRAMSPVGFSSSKCVGMCTHTRYRSESCRRIP